MFGGGGDSGPNFDLPDEILSVIPTDPFEQLDLARKITSMAIASRVSNLQAETVGLRQKLLDKESVMDELKDKMSRLERDCREANTRLKTILDENMKLSNERDSLAMTVKKLSRDVAKLETFKKQLFQSLNDDNGSQVEPVDVRTCDQSVPVSYPEKDQRSNGQRSFNRSIDMSNPVDEASRYAGQKFSITPYISPRLTPSVTPKIISASVSPRGYSAAGSPKKTSGAVSPIGSHYEGKTTAFWSSQQSSAGNSPPRGRSLPARTPRMDGKEFFRQARSRLSYEQFSAFLANIKELNAQKQTREETLRKAEEIFGMENKDLYLSFQGLINRSVR